MGILITTESQCDPQKAADVVALDSQMVILSQKIATAFDIFVDSHLDTENDSTKQVFPYRGIPWQLNYIKNLESVLDYVIF